MPIGGLPLSVFAAQAPNLPHVSPLEQDLESDRHHIPTWLRKLVSFMWPGLFPTLLFILLWGVINSYS